MYRRLPLILVVAMICLFSCVSLAQAKHTTFELKVVNKFGYTIKTVKSGDWSGTDKIGKDGSKTFKHNNTAYYMKTKRYEHKLTIKRNKKNLCVIDILIANKVRFYGDTELLGTVFRSSNTERCFISRNRASNNHSASATLIAEE